MPEDNGDPTITRPINNLLVQEGRLSASLIVLSGASIGRMFRLDRSLMVIGRSRDADIQLDDESISRHHVRLLRTEEAVQLEDLDSKNGTLLNGQPLHGKATLHNGDKFQIGSTTVLRFSVLDRLDDAVHELLYNASVRDGLTGAFNRRFFDEILGKEFAFAERHGAPLSLLMMDVDHFKKVNDAFGHPAGDLALQKIVTCVHHAIRAEDAFARFGGEEFALVLREVTEDVAVAVAERLRRQISELRPLYREQVVPLTISIGVATHATGMFKTSDALLEAADRFLLQAKEKGRNRVCSKWLQ